MQLTYLITAFMATVASCTPLEVRSADLAAVIERETGPVAALHKRECFKTGEHWGADIEHGINIAKALCTKGYLAGDVLGMDYKINESRTFCRNLSGSKSAVYTIGYHGDTQFRNLKYPECIDGLRKEIYNCGRGGVSSYGNWSYRADPNSGTCK
ncbi:hypothetical protein ACLOAV_005858 [Pseudogymnoascus australis]